MLNSARAILKKYPSAANTADVIVSNCGAETSCQTNKASSWKYFGTLKPGGHFSISDIVPGWFLA